MNYKERSARGRTIASGTVEGAVKQLVSKGLKQTGAQWRPENRRRKGMIHSWIALRTTWGKSRFNCPSEYVPDSFLEDLAKRLIATYEIEISVVDGPRGGLLLRALPPSKRL